jgi:hypothetical protein
MLPSCVSPTLSLFPAETSQVTLTYTSGLPERVCAEWRCRSFLGLPEELAPYRNPRTGFNASRNRPYSPDTVETYRGYYNAHIKGDPFTLLKMSDSEEEDATEYITRLSVKSLSAKKGKTGRPMGGTRTFAGVIGFIRMAFHEYRKKNRRWFNPFQYFDPPIIDSKGRDALPEDEMLRLFGPGFLKRRPGYS